MIEPLRRIEPADDIGHAFDGVRRAKIAFANRAKAKAHASSTLGLLSLGTVLWYTALALAVWRLPESVAVALLVRIGASISMMGAGTFLLGMLLPSVFADKPTLAKRRATKEWSFVGECLLVFCVLAILPSFTGFGFANILGTIRWNPKIKVTGNMKEDEPTASAVLADDRVRKLYGDLVGQIDDWNEAIIPVNRLIHLANAGEGNPSADEAALIAEYHEQQAELDRHVALATALLSEGPVGTRPGTDVDAEDPLLRIHDRAPRIRERMATLSDDSRRLVAAREVRATTNRL